MSVEMGLTRGEPPEIEEPQDSSRTMQVRATRARLSLAAKARVSATLLNTFLRPAATMPSPEKIPERIEGARRGGGSDPALLFFPSASWLGGYTDDGYNKE
jgi:hypothetical protein